MGSLPVNKEVNAIVVDPHDPTLVYAAGSAGVFHSNDSGLTWQASSDGLGTAAIVALTLNPSQPDTLFAATAEGSFFRSDDRAKNWHSINTTTSP